MFYYTYERKRRPMELDSLSGRPLPPPPVVSLPTDSRSARLLVAVSLDERSSFSLCFIEVLHGVSTAGPSEQKKRELRVMMAEEMGSGFFIFFVLRLFDICELLLLPPVILEVGLFLFFNYIFLSVFIFRCNPFRFAFCFSALKMFGIVGKGETRLRFWESILRFFLCFFFLKKSPNLCRESSLLL